MTTMKAATAQSFGEAAEVLDVQAVPRVSLEAEKGKLVVRVKACSLSPSEYRTLTGEASLLKSPSSFPYIPGGDISGTVVASGDESFCEGDDVVCTWGDTFGQGGLAEYSIVDASLAVKKPESTSHVIGAALANSASHALLAFEQANVAAGEKVLVLGGSGGVGSMLIQLAKQRGAWVATTSTDEALVTSLGADKCIDYRSTEWSESGDSYDVVFDCAEGRQAWKKVTSSHPTSLMPPGVRGGRFVAVVLQDWQIIMRKWWHVFTFFFPVLMRSLVAWLFPRRYPRYSMVVNSPSKESMTRVIELADKGELKCVIADPVFPFTKEGIVGAFELHQSRHAHGKVVVDLTSEK